MADDDDDQEGAVQLSDVLPDVLDDAAALTRVVNAEDPQAKRRSCLAVGDDTSGIVLVAAMAGRFDTVADISMGSNHELWRQDSLRALYPKLQIHSYDADVFDDIALAALRDNGGRRYEFVYLRKALHHLRRNQCQLEGTDDHRCGGRDCVGVFDPAEIFRRLWRFADTIIVSEHHYLGRDADKEDTARGGMLDQKDLGRMFAWLRSHASVTLYQPVETPLRRVAARTLSARLRQTEFVLFAASRS